MYYLKLVHCGLVVLELQGLDLPKYPIPQVRGWHSLGSVRDDYQKVKKLLMLDDSSSKGTISWFLLTW